jgi:hypothetical protein
MRRAINNCSFFLDTLENRIYSHSLPRHRQKPLETSGHWYLAGNALRKRLTSEMRLSACSLATQVSRYLLNKTNAMPLTILNLINYDFLYSGFNNRYCIDRPNHGSA